MGGPVELARRRGRGCGRGRRAVVAAAITVTVCAALSWPALSSAADTTNGDPVQFNDVPCKAKVSGIQLTQPTDVTVQAVVPNQVNQGDSYTITLPGGSANLPASGAGLPISQFKNLATTYMFQSSTGSVAITNVSVAGGGASGTVTWNPNDGTKAQTLPLTASFTNTTSGNIPAPSATFTTPGPLKISGSHDGTLTTPDITLTVTAPSADATVTSYAVEVDTTATVSADDALRHHYLGF